MKRIYVCCFAILLLTFSLSGCAKSNNPRVDNFFGTSFDSARESQLAYPTAGVGLRPQTGIDGIVAEKAMVRYQTSFDRPAPVTKSYSINVSGASQ